MFLRLDGLRLPLPGQRGEEIGPRGRLFKQILVAVKPVVPHGGGAEKVRLLALARCHRLHEVARGEDAAIPDGALCLVGPSGEDRGAGQVDEGLMLRDPLLPGPPDRGVPLQGDGARGKALPGLALAHEHRHRVTLRCQFAGKRRPHEPRTAGDENSHGSLRERVSGFGFRENSCSSPYTLSPIPCTLLYSLSPTRGRTLSILK